MKKLLIPILGSAMVVWLPLAVARETVVLPGVVGPVGVASGVDTQGPGTLIVGNQQNINTSNDLGGAITTNAANTASIVFNGTSTVTGFVGQTGATFLNIAAGANANTVTFTGPVYSTQFSVSGTGTVNFNGGFTSNSGSTMDFAGDGFINVGPGQTVKAAITNSAGADTGTLTLNANSILDGAVGAASGLKQINVVGGNALITGQANAAAYTLGTNTLNVAGAFAIPVAGTINTTIFSQSLYGKIVPVGAASIGNNLQVNVTVTGPIANGSNFNIVDATSGTNGSTVTATSNTPRYLFSAGPTANGLVKITTTQVPLATVVSPGNGTNPAAPIGIPVAIAPVIDALPLTPGTTPLLTAITLLPTASQVTNALAQLGPGSASIAAPLVNYRATQQLQELWASHLENAQDACAQNSQPDNRNKRQTDDADVCLANEKRSHWWMAAFGSSGEQSNTHGADGYGADSFGAMLGYDVPVSDALTVGGGFRYARSKIDGDTFDDQTKANSYQAMAYLGYAPGPWYVNASLVYGVDDYTGSRRVVFPGFDSATAADYGGHQYTAFAATGYHFRLGDADSKTTITPIATLQYTRMNTDNYTENGGDGINLRVNSRSYDFIQTGLGAKIAHDFALSGTQTLRPDFHVNWLHSLGATANQETATFTSAGPAFAAIGPNPGRDLYDVGASVVFASANIWSVQAVYDYEWNQNYRQNQVMLNFAIRL